MSAAGPVVAIVGPTASGKSALARLVAERLQTSIVSVDAMQVYRGMDVGTAKTPASDRTRPLLMVDVCDPAQSYSARLFQKAARSCVDDLLCAGRVPVLCGGTGLYLNAVVDEMAFPAGEVGDARRARYEALAAERGPDALHALLAERDPASAALIHPHNVRRVVRALEMLDEGVSYARHHEGLHERASHYGTRIWGLTMARERLYARIDERVDQMVAHGLVEEVARLAQVGLTAESTAGQAIGYKEVLGALAGRCTLDEALDQVRLRSRRYAKRQLSWFRRDARVRWIDLDETDLEGACALVVGSLAEKENTHGAL
ncbi:tRNA (adenosine(37)-N6)-dimethylallyltransferase MiaA [Thermophilibacter immobilis]|jgi:tRNA dimethylallyltransferase|uniref:tRNA dimethylallyltransferase n=1 Tax=Thermophilibacter immobilis TaxID=2779519 RepID=A0A7S7RUN9_9ACTN|nr:tRNA (adenosine(37)-N6)-dimethylallyltransferase MiaA [Thermophilibacter immobilis]QOY61486.1 tRNA (adenosine(37)-N6)-dimethylallyltransferase MiaA [Thermophilibacter immobilis]